jgi:hypothetical protein
MHAVAFLCSIVAAVPPSASDPKVAVVEQSVIAVTTLRRDSGIEPGAGATLDELVLQSLARYPNVRVLGQSDIAALLSQEARNQLLGCTDESCLAEIGGALGAALLVDGGVGKLEDRWLVNLKLLDTKASEVLGRASEEASSLDGLGERVPSLVEHLFKSAALSGRPRGEALAQAVGWQPLSAPRRLSPYFAGAAALGLFAAGVWVDLAAERHAADARESVAGTPRWRDAKVLAESRARLGDSLLLGGVVAAGASAILYLWNLRAAGGAMIDVGLTGSEGGAGVGAELLGSF